MPSAGGALRAGQPGRCVQAHTVVTGFAQGGLSRRGEGPLCGDCSAILEGLGLPVGQSRSRRVGSGRSRPFAFEGRGSRLLVCSDGLTGYLRGERLAEVLAEAVLERAVDALVESVRLPSGGFMDDIALVLVDIRA